MPSPPPFRHPPAVNSSSRSPPCPVPHCARVSRSSPTINPSRLRGTPSPESTRTKRGGTSVLAVLSLPILPTQLIQVGQRLGRLLQERPRERHGQLHRLAAHVLS